MVSRGAVVDELSEGLYESLLTHRLRARLTAVPALAAELDTIDVAEQPEILARHLREVALRILSAQKEPAKRVELVNSLLALLDQHDDAALDSPQQLLSLSRTAGPGRSPVSTVRPATPLSDAALLTNARGEPSLGAELRAELVTADGVDLLCAFVKWHGLRILESEFQDLRRRGVPLRVVTTTYMGATERVALDRLVRDFGAEVRIQYDVLRTRLHAKAWLFRRRTEFDTAYVGSSNLSRAALLDGVEWNVRLSRVATPTLLAKFGATFDTYWNDGSFERYDPDHDRDRLDDALAVANGSRTDTPGRIMLSGLEVRPYPYQIEMLEALTAERELHDRHRNLIVAATGTGKTVVAALDYRRLCRDGADRPSLLFVAHRREILEQSLRTYREVLADHSFGELYVNGSRPERWRHVFASVQSLHSYGVTTIPSDAYDIVVIDEFHHAEALTYRAILQHLTPAELLGLTATPERADGVDVREFFDGRTAAELLLWDALSADLLIPFHYFGIADGTDLRRVAWSRGHYDLDALSNVYTGNAARARLVLKGLRDKVSAPHRMRALGFCVSVAHAEYMTRYFMEAGVPAATVTGQTRQGDRDRALADLRDRRVNILFTVDVFNEGIDLPDVDTVLFLRPTESATVFLQQLGRGLRRAPNKAVLTALDFVGHHRREFRFDVRYRAITGSGRRDLVHQIELGFPFLPSGSQIVLDRQTQQLVLENIKSQVSNRWKDIVAELRAGGESTLPAFLDSTGVELSDIVRSDRTWTRLRRDAGLPTRQGGPAEEKLLRRCRALAHVDDPARLHNYRPLLDEDVPAYAELSAAEQGFARMLLFSLWPDGKFGSYEEGLAALAREPAVRDDLRTVIDLAFDRSRHPTSAPQGPLRELGLRVHARYQREEILAALDHATLARVPSFFREGVLYSEKCDADAFFVTLKKSETDYSPTTMYQDYAISPELFHWESQSTTSSDSKTGQRYIHHQERGSSILLFTRERKTDAMGTAPYVFLGTATYVTHTGDRPMGITWRLDTPMPMDVFTAAAVAQS
jgi:superfamily II DNA or RNA helicase/HKD family nuclease